jgi:hypothetical protein
VSMSETIEQEMISSSAERWSVDSRWNPIYQIIATNHETHNALIMSTILRRLVLSLST